MGNLISSSGGQRAKPAAPERTPPLRQAWEAKGRQEPPRAQVGQPGPDVPSHGAQAQQAGQPAHKRSLSDLLRKSPVTVADLLSGKGLVHTRDARADHESNLSRILACAPQMDTAQLAQALRVATQLHPRQGPCDPRIEATWHALTYYDHAPEPATLRALAAGFAGAYDGFAQDIIARLAPRLGWLVPETHLPFLGGCLGQFSRDRQAPGDLLAQQIEWVLSFKRGFVNADVRREMLAALILAQPLPADEQGRRISDADLDRLLQAATGRLEAGKLENLLRAKGLYLALLPESQHAQVNRAFDPLLPCAPRRRRPHPVAGACRPPAASDEPSARQPAPPSQKPAPLVGPPADSKHAARDFRVEIDGKADPAMARRADRVAQALRKVFALPSWDGSDRQGLATQAVRAALHSEDPPETVGVVLQLLLRTPPEGRPSDLLIALRALAGAAGDGELGTPALDSLLHALAVSNWVNDAFAGVLMEELGKRLQGTTSPEPLRAYLAGFLIDCPLASASRLEALRVGAMRSGALAGSGSSTRSRSDAAGHG